MGNQPYKILVGNTYMTINPHSIPMTRHPQPETASAPPGVRATHTRRTIPGYPGYEATKDGQIWSVTSDWRGYGERQLQPDLNEDGYHSVRVYSDGKRIRKSVHYLIAITFLERRPSEKHEVRHINGCKLDNRIENLAWGTRQENADDREKHGRTSRGEKHSEAIKAGLNKSQSTPGPWRVEEVKIDGWDSFNIKGNGPGIPHNITTIMGYCDHAPANARLIAAAPDLLLIAKEIADSGCDLGNSERRIRLYAAITKGGGEL